MISYRKGKSQKDIQLKLSYEGLRTDSSAGFVQACRNFLDLFTCRSQMFLSVQSPIEAGRRTFPKHSLGTPENLKLIVACGSLLSDWHSQQGSKQCWRTKGKAWMFCLVIGTLYSWFLRSYLRPDATSKTKMVADDEYVTCMRDPGRARPRKIKQNFAV